MVTAEMIRSRIHAQVEAERLRRKLAEIEAQEREVSERIAAVSSELSDYSFNRQLNKLDEMSQALFLRRLEYERQLAVLQQ